MRANIDRGHISKIVYRGISVHLHSFFCFDVMCSFNLCFFLNCKLDLKWFIFFPGSTTPQHQGQTPRAGPSTAGMDWAKAAQMWAKRSGSTKPTTPRHGQSPRGVRPSPRPSPRHEGYGGGDSTPLFDERWSGRDNCTDTDIVHCV